MTRKRLRRLVEGNVLSVATLPVSEFPIIDDINSQQSVNRAAM